MGLAVQVQAAICFATLIMTTLARGIALRMFREWRQTASQAMLANAFCIWKWVFVAACFQVVYAWRSQNSHNPVPDGTAMAFRDIHWLIVFGLVSMCACDPSSIKRSRAFRVVMIGYVLSTLQKILAIAGFNYWVTSLDWCIFFCFAAVMASRLRRHVNAALT